MEQHYRRHEVIGRGNFGVVYKGQNIKTNKVVAIKILNLDTINDDVEDVQREIALLAQLSKKDFNIIKYYESFLVGTKLWIIMDLCAGGSIRTLLKAGPLEERHLAIVLREMLIGISHMHSEGIIHRDLKAANVLITLEGHVRLCDFGVAADTDINRTKRTTLVGTPYWMAPEVVIEGQTYNVKADIWSAGITVFEMATGNPPYSDQEAVRALLMISKGRPPRLEGPSYSPLLKDIVAQCLDEDPNARPSADDLLKHKFIKQYQKLGSGVLRELIDRYRRWQDHNRSRRDSLAGVEDDVESIHIEGDDESLWDFDVDSESQNEEKVLEYLGQPPASLGELFEGEGKAAPASPPPPTTTTSEGDMTGPNSAPSGSMPPPSLTNPHFNAPSMPHLPSSSTPALNMHAGATSTAQNIQQPLGAAYSSARVRKDSDPRDYARDYSREHPLRLNRTKSQAAHQPLNASKAASQSMTAINALQTSPGRDPTILAPVRSRAHSHGQTPISPVRRVPMPASMNARPQQIKVQPRIGQRMMSVPKLPVQKPPGTSPSSPPPPPPLQLRDRKNNMYLQLPPRKASSVSQEKFPAIPALQLAILSDSTSGDVVSSQLSQLLESFSQGLKCLDAKLGELQNQS